MLALDYSRVVRQKQRRYLGMVDSKLVLYIAEIND